MSEKEIPDLDQNTVDFVLNFFKDTIDGIKSQFEDRIVQLSKDVEAIEKQIASLVVAYGEQAVFMEALVAQIAFASDEQREMFNKDVSEARKQMLDVMKNASEGFLADDDPQLAAAISGLVDEQSSGPNS